MPPILDPLLGRRITPAMQNPLPPALLWRELTPEQQTHLRQTLVLIVQALFVPCQPTKEQDHERLIDHPAHAR